MNHENHAFTPRWDRFTLVAFFRRLRLGAGGAGWLLSERMIRMGAGFYVGILSARTFAPDQFGILSWAISITAIFSPFLTQGLETIVPRDLIQHDQQRAELLGSAFALKIVGGLFVLVLVPLVGFFLNPSGLLGITTLLIIQFGLLFQLLDVFEYPFIARCDRKTPAMIRSIVGVVMSGAKILALLKYPDIRIFAALTSLEVITSWSSLWLIGRMDKYHFPGLRFSWIEMRRMWKESSWALISAFATMMFLRVDQLIVEKLLGSHSLGVYAAAVKLAEITYILPVALSASAYPILVKARCRDTREFETAYQTMSRKMIYSGVLVAVLISLSGSLLAPLLYGHRYMQSGFILSVYVWSLLPIAANQCVGKWLVISGQVKLLAVFQGVGCVLNVLLNFMLIPFMGLSGAIVATLASYLATGIIAPAVVPSTRRSVLLMAMSILRTDRIRPEAISSGRGEMS